MVRRYPSVVFSGRGPREVQLAETATRLVASFEVLLVRLAEPIGGGKAANDAGPMIGASEAGAARNLPPSPLTSGMTAYREERRLHREGQQQVPQHQTLEILPSSVVAPASVAALLVQFDQDWVQFLDQFVVWKTEDAVSLESELVRVCSRSNRFEPCPALPCPNFPHTA